MKIALAQICSTRDVANNLQTVRNLIIQAAAQGAELVVFPEATMRAFGHNLTQIAEPADGPFADAVEDIARNAGVTVILGMFTPAHPASPDKRLDTVTSSETNTGSSHKVRNTLLVAGPGERVIYDKIHLFDAFGFAESDTVEGGQEEVRIEFGGTTIGLAICYDIRFPQLFINHGRAGASVVVVPTSWGAGESKLEQWEVLTRARALDSTCWIVACGQANPTPSGVDATPGAPTGIGHSLVVAPDGTVTARAGEAPELLVVDLDPGRVNVVRKSIPVLANARLS